MSKKLWLPTAIDCVDMDLSSSSTSSRRLIQNSWFLVKAIKRKTYLGSLPTISSPYTTSSQSVMDSDLPKIGERGKELRYRRKAQIFQNLPPKEDKKPLKTLKIKIFPNEKQLATLNMWFNIARWTYNKCLKAIKSKKAKINIKSLRETCLNSTYFDDIPQKLKEHILATSYDI